MLELDKEPIEAFFKEYFNHEDISIWLKSTPYELLATIASHIPNHTGMIKTLAGKILNNPKIVETTEFDLSADFQVGQTIDEIYTIHNAP